MLGNMGLVSQKVVRFTLYIQGRSITKTGWRKFWLSYLWPNFSFKIIWEDILFKNLAWLHFKFVNQHKHPNKHLPFFGFVKPWSCFGVVHMAWSVYPTIAEKPVVSIWKYLQWNKDTVNIIFVCLPIIDQPWKCSTN